MSNLPKVTTDSAGEEAPAGFHPLEIPGFEGRDLGFQVVGILATSKLLLDGTEVALSDGKAASLTDNEGQTIAIEVQPRMHDLIPKVVANGVTYDPAPPLPMPSKIWACFPLGFAITGGAFPVLAGAMATAFNMRVMRGDLGALTKFLVCGAVTTGTFVGLVIFATLLQLLLS